MDSGKNYLMPGVSKREVLAWASYDFANSGYTTVILTAVYNAFFVSVLVKCSLGNFCLDAYDHTFQFAFYCGHSGDQRVGRCQGQ